MEFELEEKKNRLRESIDVGEKQVFFEVVLSPLRKWHLDSNFLLCISCI